MGQSSALFFNGELISQDKVLKETARYRDDQSLIIGSEEPRLPEGVTIQGTSDEIPIEESKVSDASAMVTIQDPEPFRSPTQSLIMLADNGHSEYQELGFMDLARQHNISRYSTSLNSPEFLHDWWEALSIPTQSPFTQAFDNYLVDPNFGIMGSPVLHNMSPSLTPLNGAENPDWLVATPLSLEFRQNLNDTVPLDTLSLIQGLGTLKIRGFNCLMRAIVDRCVTKTIPLLSQRAAQALKSKEPEDQFLQLIIMLFMNNFAGSNEEVFEDLFKQLQYFSIQQATLLLDAIPHPYSTALQQSILTIAIKFGAQSIVKILLERDIDQNTIYCVSGRWTMTPLQFACRRRNFEIAQLLINSGADVNIGHNMGNTAISHLLDIQLDDKGTYPSTVGRILALLLEAGADPRCGGLRSTRFWNTQSVVDVFLKCGRTPEVHHHLALTANVLESAFSCLDHSGALAATRILLGPGSIFGADLEIETGKKLSDAFNLASLKGHEGVVEFFLKAEFKPTIESLAAAVEGKSMSIIYRLLQCGVKPDSSFRVSERHMRSRPFTKAIQPGLMSSFSYHGQEETTPFAEAVRFQNREAVDLFQKELGFDFNLVKPTESNDLLLYNLLNAASEVGDIEMIENLLRQLNRALHISDTWKYSETVLSCFHLATFGHHEVVVNKLLENGILPADPNGLLSALVVQDQTLVRLFLDLAVPLGDDPAFMWFAVRWGNLDVMQDLIDAGAALYGYVGLLRLLSTYLNFAFPHTNSLGEALKKQDRQVTELLIRNGAVFGTRQSAIFGIHTEYTPLTVAVQSGDINMVQSLLSSGADPNDPTALLEAVSQSPIMVQAILEAFDGRYHKCKTLLASKVLRKAIQDSMLEQVSLFARYTDLNDKFQLGEYARTLPSPLGEAIAGCNLDIIKTLHDNGGDINGTVLLQARAPSRGRWLAIHMAIYTKNLAVVQLLCTLGARVNCKAELGITRTPLQLATELGSHEIVEFLIRHCDADVNAEPCIWKGRTALQLAASLCYVQIAELLLQYGADINARRGKYEGRTAFEGAAEHGRIEMLLFLSRNGLDLPLDEDQVHRAMDFAAKNGQTAARELVKTISQLSHPSLCGSSPRSITC
jgi:ankyrin repeat protein